MTTTLAIHDDDQPCAATAPSASTGVPVRTVRRDGGEGESRPRVSDRVDLAAVGGPDTRPRDPVTTNPCPRPRRKRKLVMEEPARYVRGPVSRNENSRAGKTALSDTPVGGGRNRCRNRRRTTRCGRLCDSGGAHPLTLCSQGETRVSNRTPLVAATPYIPYACDVDWMCDQGLGIALGD